jgi:hypothetical protein
MIDDGSTTMDMVTIPGMGTKIGPYGNIFQNIQIQKMQISTPKN